MLFLSETLIEFRRELLKRMERVELTRRQAFEQALEADPFDHLSLAFIAGESLERGEIDRARDYFWRALRACPSAVEGYVGLNKSYVDAGDDPELLAGLTYLVIRRLAHDPNYREGVLKGYRKDLGRKAKGVPDDVLTYATDKLALATEGQPERVTTLLRPYRLIQDILDPPLDGMSEETVDSIAANALECEPLVVGILRGFARNTHPPVSAHSAQVALALLGEMGSRESFSGVMEFADLKDDSIAEAACWAARRMSSRFPELAPEVEDLPPVEPDLTVYDFCCVVPEDENGDLLDEDEFEDDEEDEEVVQVVKPVRPGRNEPCWCGSGKKYKKCHLASDEEEDRRAVPASEDPVTHESELITSVLSWIDKNVPRKEMDVAFDEFFGGELENLNEDDQAAFLEWLLNDFSPRGFGKPVAQEYLLRNRQRLGERDREILQRWGASHYSLFEVQRVEKGKGVEVKDLLAGGESFLVHDVTSSKTLTQWDCLLTRTCEEEGRTVFAGNGLIVSRTIMPRLRAWIDADKLEKGIPWPEYLRANSHRIRLQHLELQKSWRDNLVIATAEGDPVTLSKATFEILDAPALSSALDSCDVLTDRREEDGAVLYTWLERAAGEEGSVRILGSVTIEGSKLTLETMSRQRLERGVALLRGLAGNSIKERRQEFQDAKAAMKESRRAPREESPVPPEVEKKFLTEYLEKHYSDWPDTPLPGLDGQTPRQAAGKPKMRARLIEMLKGMENGEQRKRKKGDAWYDFSRIKAELGISGDTL